MYQRFLASLLLVTTVTAFSVPLGSDFTYQGFLKQAGEPASGSFDFEFHLYAVDGGGLAIADPVILDDVIVHDGVFTVSLDFDTAPFAGDALWLEVRVREGASSGGYTGLLPRQKLSAVPYALHAEMVAMNSVGSPAIINDSITSADIGPNAVGRSEIATGAVSQAELATGAVATDEIVDSSILARDVDLGEIQHRLTQACAPGFSIREVFADGTVSCEFDSTVGVSGPFSAQIFNGNFTPDSIAITPRDDRICFLTYVSLRDVDAGSEDAWCRIYPDVVQSIDVWILQASSEDDSDARCEMRCIDY